VREPEVNPGSTSRQGGLRILRGSVINPSISKY